MSSGGPRGLGSGFCIVVNGDRRTQRRRQETPTLLRKPLPQQGSGDVASRHPRFYAAGAGD
jgi:hypothetical protein